MSETLYRLKPRRWALVNGKRGPCYEMDAGGGSKAVIYEGAVDEQGVKHPFVWLTSGLTLRTPRRGCETLEAARLEASTWADRHFETTILPMFEPALQEATVE